MRLHSRGYGPDSATEDFEKDWPSFCCHLDLLLENERNIFNCAEYFFCNPSFAYCSWPYVRGDGKLYLGYLLLGWKADQLTGSCSDCNSKVLITSFAGSMLSGSNSWTGICLGCRQKQKGGWQKFSPAMSFIQKLGQLFPAAVAQEEEYDTQEFTWGGDGLTPARKRRTIWKPVAEPVTLSNLVEELKTGNIRKDMPVNVHLLKKDLELKFSSN